MPAQRSTQRRLSEGEKRAIVALVATGASIAQAAQQFSVHRNTVSALCKPVRAVPDSVLSASWKNKLMEQLPAQSVAAIERSVLDTVDVHKAAATGIAHLKGIGVLNADTQAIGNVNVFLAQTLALPADLKAAYSDDDILITATDVTPVTDVAPTTTDGSLNPPRS